MANSHYLTQYRVDSESGYKQENPEPEHTRIVVTEFTALLRQYWPATSEPHQWAKDSWQYILRKTQTDVSTGELNLIGNTISERKIGVIRLVLLSVIFQRFVKRPAYLWHDSNLEDFFEITDSTTEHDILLWLDSR